MRLVDAQTDSARERQREANLDDLENAFKQESPLTDSYDESSKQDSDAFLPFPDRDKSNGATDTTTHAGNVDLGAGTAGTAGLGATETIDSSLKNTFAPAPSATPKRPVRVLDPFDDDSGPSSVPVDVVGNNRINMNSNSERQGLTSNDPFRNGAGAGAGAGTGMGGYPTRRASVGAGSRRSSNYGPVNTPPDQYDYSDYYPSRRSCIVACLVLLAIIGLAIGILAGGTMSTSRVVSITAQPSITMSPTPSPTEPLSEYDRYFIRGTRLIQDSMVSDFADFGRVCHHKRCGGDGDMSNLSIQDRVMTYLVFEDELFRDWAWRDDFPAVERVVQRYILTLFAFATGLEKDASGELPGFIVNTWKESGNWLNGEDECNWFGITCDTRSAYIFARDFVNSEFMTASAAGTATARADLPNAPVVKIPMVTSISLNKNTLKGELMPELFRMRHLEMIELWQAELIGTIHADIKNLVSLKKLWLHETVGLTGSLPKEIGSLSNLESLFVGGNMLTGALPNMTLLTNLNTLAVNDNAFKGSIPTTIAKATGLERLFLDENKFSGSLPIELGFLTNLTDVRFNNNEFTGPLPYTLSALKNLKVLYLYDNEFDGGLDNFLVTGWASMTYFEAQNNKFGGVVPASFGRLPLLITLNLAKNMLTSMIPPELCRDGAKKLIKLDLSSNRISDQLPTSLAQCRELETLILSNNQMTGVIPAFMSTFPVLKTLKLDRNLFRGEVSPNIGGANLKTLHLIGNPNLADDIPKSLCDRTTFISADCDVGGLLQCEQNCCDCCNLSQC